MNTAFARVRYRGGLRLMLAPYLVGMVALVLVPAVVTVGYAFREFDTFTPGPFSGLENVRRVFAYPEMRRSLIASGIFLAAAVPLRIAGGLFLALLANGRGRLAGATRLAVYAPVVVPDAAVALAWLWIVNPYYGPVGAAMRLFGGTPTPILLDSGGAIATLVGISFFAMGEGFLVTLAARREVSETLYEAARMEGAGPWARFRRITLPLMAPTLGLLAARDLLLSMQVVLVPTLLLTRGGPLGATKTLPVLVYERSFIEARLGEGSAVAVMFWLLALVPLGAFFLVRWVLGRRRAAAWRAGGPEGESA